MCIEIIPGKRLVETTTEPIQPCIPTKIKLTTLMQDPQYRLSIAWQNVGYNQPPHTSYFMGDGMKLPVKPLIKLVGKKNK